MKNPSNYLTPILVFFFTLSIKGTNLYAKPEQRPHSLQKHGPKKHAEKKHKYYYYPKQNVYYSPAEKVYFVWERTHWKPHSHLPDRQVSVSYSSSPKFTLWVASTHPYYYNPAHRKTYHEYRVVKQKPAPRARTENESKSNVSFNIEINPVVVESKRTVIVHEHHKGHGHHPKGHHDHGKGKKGHGKGRH